MKSLVAQHFNEKLKEAEFQVGVMLYMLGMIWTLGLILPTMLLL